MRPRWRSSTKCSRAWRPWAPVVGNRWRRRPRRADLEHRHVRRGCRRLLCAFPLRVSKPAVPSTMPSRRKHASRSGAVGATRQRRHEHIEYLHGGYVATVVAALQHVARAGIRQFRRPALGSSGGRRATASGTPNPVPDRSPAPREASEPHVGRTSRPPQAGNGGRCSCPSPPTSHRRFGSLRCSVIGADSHDGRSCTPRWRFPVPAVDHEHASARLPAATGLHTSSPAESKGGPEASARGVL